MAEYARQRKIFLMELEGQPAGYLLNEPMSRDTPGLCLVHQACVQYDARHRQVGLNAIRRLTLSARQAGAGIIHLWCRSNLDANLFWLAAGFSPRAIKEGGKARGLPVIGWRYPIVTGANLDAPHSARRRSECGKVIALSDAGQREAVIEACKTGSTAQLFKLLKRA